MKKVMMLVLCIVVFASLSMAQTYVSGATGLTGKDVLGAHNNGGRGCAGCHAPHSGGLGGGGNAVNGSTWTADQYSGTNALFGQDLTPVYTLTMNLPESYAFQLEGASALYSTNTEELRGIAMCLACHDGAQAKGAMMAGTSWEQSNNLLPVGLYGNQGIPTLLGNDNGQSTAGYGNDHPVGPKATLGAVRIVSSNAATTPLLVTMNGTSVQSIVPNSAAAIAFNSNYGFPAIAGTSWSWGVANPDGGTDPTKLFMTCTTCHNQHVMYVYKGTGGKFTGSSISSSSYYPTYFFVNGPYNPGAGNADPTKAASTTQFCRQCHIGEANETFGVNNVTTKY